VNGVVNMDLKILVDAELWQNRLEKNASDML